MKYKILNGLFLSAAAAFGTLIVATFSLPDALLSKTFLGDSQPVYVVRVTVDRERTSEKGSGTLIRSDLILTCNHVIRDARPGDRIFVTFKNGLERDAQVVKTNKDLDLAVLRIEPVILPSARPARKAVIKDQEVVIGGFPKGKDYAEFRGRVVGFRDASRDSAGKELFIVSRRTESGVSGGPVFNMGGEVVGVLFGSLRFANCTGLEAIKVFLSDVK